METLYQVIMVGDQRDIIIDEKVVAKDEENAKFKVGVYEKLRKLVLDLDDVTVIVTPLGRVKVAVNQ